MNKENVLKSICWDITSKCNDNCKFCYRNPTNKNLTLYENKKILKKMIDFGVDKISFVGGEPLLYENLFELLEWGKYYSKGKTLFSITTNGILLSDYRDGKIYVKKEKISEIVELVDWITFSLDAPNSVLQSEMGRNKQHFERILLLIQYLNVTYPKLKIKINTIVSKINYKDLRDLYDILIQNNIKRWKLFRFLPSRGNAISYKDDYWIAKDEFERTIEDLKELNLDRIIITINGYEEFDNSYITISSEGMLVVYNNNYVEKVNLLNDPFEEVIKHIDLYKHIKQRAEFKRVTEDI